MAECVSGVAYNLPVRAPGRDISLPLARETAGVEALRVERAVNREALSTSSVERMLHDAQHLLRTVYAERGWSGRAARWAEVRAEILRSSGWVPTTAELTHGAQLAWRNSARCVGRSYWPSLEVRDLRHVHQPDEVFAHLVAHLRQAWNGGRIKPLMSIFAPGVRIVNDQLIRYAGYRQADGTVVGDPKNADLTGYLRDLGWAGGPGTPFDVLPIAIEHHGRVKLYELPADAVHEVPLSHPESDSFARLGLKWHALPVISDLRLELGGLGFSCAPFNGWYLQTEIAARNLADEDRYHQLLPVARALGLDTRRERTLWKDRALLELNVAVLHSFDAAGVKISDHHTVTRHFVRFEERERRAGRRVAGRWSWLVPPLSPATTPVYHRHYEDRTDNPNFYPQACLWREKRPVSTGCPFGARRKA